MESTFEKNRLRYSGNIPQETLDYLTAKKKHDFQLHLLVLPFVLSVGLLSLFVFSFKLLFHYVSGFAHYFFLYGPIVLLTNGLVRVIRKRRQGRANA